MYIKKLKFANMIFHIWNKAVSVCQRFRVAGITAALFWAVFPSVSAADGLPQLPVSNAVQTGVLDNGISYYIVTNSAVEQGKAEIALVQRGGTELDYPGNGGASEVNAMASLTQLPHFKAETPFKYLSHNCIWPESSGYVSVYPDATIYRFPALDLSRSKDIVDSTLLLVFDIIGSQAATVHSRYVPQNQAIVVVGDINPSAVLNKMNMLSLLVTRSRDFPVKEQYTWTPEDGPKYSFTPAGPGTLTSVEAVYRSPRVPQENMNTVQVLVSDKFAAELGIVLRKRLSKALREAEVPVANIGYKHTASYMMSGDETYRISVTTDSLHIDKASSILSSVLSGLDIAGVSEEEYKDVQNELSMTRKREFIGDILSNTQYVSQCVASFLYGSSLSSPSTDLNFFSTKNIDDALSTRLFNNFLSALLDSRKNLTLHFAADTSSVREEKLMTSFFSGWKDSDTYEYKISGSDTLTLSKLTAKTKIKSYLPEPVTGGQMWVFDNGIRVIYKSIPGIGMFRYMWLLKGGNSIIQGMRPGESAYLSDMLSLYNVGPMSCYDFRNMLSANGITMNTEITESDFRISGAAPSSRVRLLLKSLYSLSHAGTPNKEAYDYYRRCMAMKNERGISGPSGLDSLMFPGNDWTQARMPISLSDNFQKQADKFFAYEFAKMNDGVLVLIGDFDEYALRKDLSRDLGSFSTERTSSYRSRSQYRASSGYASKVKRADERGIEVGVSIPLIYSASSFMSTHMAAYAMSDALQGELAKFGWYGEGSWEFTMFPEERFNFRMACAPAARSGMPASLFPEDSVETVVSGLRSTLRRLSAGITSEDVAIYRSSLLKTMESTMPTPDMMMQMVALRYSFGKDIATRYQDKINGISDGEVNDILSRISESRMAMYAFKPIQRGPHILEAKVARPVFDTYVPKPEPWPDPDRINSQAYRAIGLDTTACDNYWLTDASLPELVSLLPPPRTMPVVVKIDTIDLHVLDTVKIPENVELPEVDSIAVMTADSLLRVIVHDNPYIFTSDEAIFYRGDSLGAASSADRPASRGGNESSTPDAVSIQIPYLRDNQNKDEDDR